MRGDPRGYREICDYSRGYNGTQSAFADTPVGDTEARRATAVPTNPERAASRGLRGFL
jgi:hypothetical protein